MDERGQLGSGPDRGEGTPSDPSSPEGTTWYTTGDGAAAPPQNPAGTPPGTAGGPGGGDHPSAPDVDGIHEAGWDRTPAGAAPAERPTWGEPVPGGAGPRNRSWKKIAGTVVVAAVVVAGGVVGVNAMASSAEGTGSSQQRPGGMGGYGMNGFPGGMMPGTNGGQGRQGFGEFGLTAALHGDFVVSSGSSYETRRMQRGKITAIGGGTVSITSDDGYSSNYAVGDVDVSSLAVGATVIAIGAVSGGTATLTSLVGAETAGIGTGQSGGTGGTGSGVDPRRGRMGDPQSGTDPQQGGSTGGGQDGQQAPTTSGTTANA